MHIIETMSAVTGLKIHRPYIHTEEVILPYKKYITFHPVHTKGTRRKYDHWPEVVKNLKYNILQVGESDAIDYSKYGINTTFLDNTNVHQLAYIIKHAQLHLGYDSLPVHLASYFKTPIVALYSQWSSHSYPYFSNNYAIIEPDYSKIGIKPSFNDNDNFNLINYITPEKVIDAVHTMLERKKNVIRN